ncbi:hypothetical protein [Azospirillum doebereinerae]|uniref:Uncharacterized protein n=1 Tax=Azospirillum doebereinerae TaxID=92933 RepID=A0A3S0WLW6_9PROT|nr:hypothetical protein [Azospirillum doebereinerae]RUQ70816.1 hypothetical protein EJ913_13735 [Azospirillum doebereinerae]
MADAIDDLIANPTAFLSKNVIENYDSPASGLCDGSVEAVMKGHVRSADGHSMGNLTYLSLTPTASKTARIAWLKYNDNMTTTLDVGFWTSAKVVMTNLLTGCSFGVKRFKMGGIRIAHSNLKTAGQINVAANATALTGYGVQLHKAGYITGTNDSLGAECCIVYGVAGTFGWTFYAQILRNYSGGYGEVNRVVNLG